MSYAVNAPDYTVQFANLRRIADNIEEPWKSELEDEIASLAEAIEEHLAELVNIDSFAENAYEFNTEEITIASVSMR
jgi:hypothetical protein